MRFVLQQFMRIVWRSLTHKRNPGLLDEAQGFLTINKIFSPYPTISRAARRPISTA